MGRRTQIDMDLDGLDAALSTGKVRAELERVGEQIAAKARASAPVQSGEYRDSIGIEIDDSGPRPKAVVYAFADHAFAVEAATGNLARAARG